MKPILFIATVLLLITSCEPTQTPSDADATTDSAQQGQAMAAMALERLEASEGGQRVLRAIEAHGGLEAWYAAPTSSYTWEYANVDNDIRFKTHMVVDNYTRTAYHDLLELGTFDNPQPVEGRFAWDGTDAWISPDTLRQPNPRFWATTGFYFESIPFILADPGLQYEIMPDEELDGTMYDMVKVSYDAGVGDSPGDIYILYLDKETAQVFAIRYTVTYGQSKEDALAREQRQTLFYYKDYVTVDGLTVATFFEGHHFADGQIIAPKNNGWASNISFKEPFDPTQLIMPEGSRVQQSPR